MDIYRFILNIKLITSLVILFQATIMKHEIDGKIIETKG